MTFSKVCKRQLVEEKLAHRLLEGMLYYHRHLQVVYNICSTSVKMQWRCARVFGYPDLVITITCNTNWKEIQNFVSYKGQKACDRPNIVSRVFKMKLDQMIKDFKKK